MDYRAHPATRELFQVQMTEDPRTANSAGGTGIALHFEAHRDELLRFLRSRLSSPEQADDLLQQTFLRLLQRADRLVIENPRAYLKMTARHVLADFYRQQKVHDGNAEVGFEEDQHFDDRWSPSRLLQSHDELEQLAATLKSLSASVRNSFILSRFYGYTYTEIGKMLGLSPRTVEKHVAKGLAKCFEQLDKAAQ
jgi:RNA polymerase sigma-70 factor (ECF subfamily)